MSSDSPETPGESLWDNLPAVKWLALAFVVLVGGYFLLEVISIRGPSRPNFRNEMNNMRQIGMALFEFKSDFGRMPDESTIGLVRERFPETWIPMGTTSSNDYFHQLLAAEIVNCPLIFHGKGIATQRPFEMTEGQPPLPPGTCGFAYIIHTDDLIRDDTPLVVFPLVRGELIFDKKLCKKNGDHALVLFANVSVEKYPLDSNGRLILNGRDFFDPAQSHWHGGKFRVVWPE